MTESGHWRHDRIGAAETGRNPMVLTRLPSGFAVIGDTQFLPGYCLLLAAPRTGALTDLPRPARQRFLLDMSLIGEAIEQVCWPDGLIRVNYEILGNTDPYLHAHIFPRYRWEPHDLLPMPVWHYPADRWRDPAHAYSPDRHGDLRDRLTAALNNLLATPTEHEGAHAPRSFAGSE